MLESEPPPAQTPDPGGGGQPRQTHRRPRKPKSQRNGDSSSAPSSSRSTQRPPVEKPPVDRQKNPRRRFNAKLTTPDEQPAQEGSSKHPPRPQVAPPPDDNADLATRLSYALRTSPYPDCPICFAALHPAQPTWSCVDGCWSNFHLKCARAWASKSVKETEDAFRARDEMDRPGEWRCPGCQMKRREVPVAYMCFCDAVRDPKPGRLAIPHSCGNPCSRKRRQCSHPCPLSCHPGPCPPCQITVTRVCFCGKQTLSSRCGTMTVSSGLSCNDVCGQILGCGNHHCMNICHAGDCQPCTVTERAKCYCGKSERVVGCGFGEVKACIRDDIEWRGRFTCDSLCDQPFDCGLHTCEKSCHVPSANAAHCPRSPDVITHCPCGKTALADGKRTSCVDPIPTCGSTCMKPLEGCDHVCAISCHLGPCPPCTTSLILPCRCGLTTRPVPCHVSQRQEGNPVLCERPCGGLRNCGRHRCNRPCCPLAALSATIASKGKGKKKAIPIQDPGDDPANAVWHACDIVCGRQLSCGNHACEEPDHKGSCPPCLRSTFEEVICHCGRTVIEPPIPCGFVLRCTFQCARPPLACGHPPTPHPCHSDVISCPPCPFLTKKSCACGKNPAVGNVRCSQERVSCGQTCGKLLACGFHHCERLCHGDDCGQCTAVCGKPRKTCLPDVHSCALPCHAPSACDESEPCRAVVIATCQCGRIQQRTACGRSTLRPGESNKPQVKCTNECAVAKRNAKLADALGISAGGKDREIVWPDEIVASAKADSKFTAVVEKNLGDFISSDRKIQLLPHMPEVRRNFVRGVAAIYRIDTQLVDREPLRAVQLIRRIDSRRPNPLLSSLLQPAAPLGKLADLRSRPISPAVVAPATKPSSSTSASTPAAAKAPRAWNTTKPAAVAKEVPKAPTLEERTVVDDWEDDDEA